VSDFWKASSQQVARRVLLEGRVQGVGCRAQVQEWVMNIGHISGYVANLSDGRVEIKVKGDDWRIERLVGILREKMYPPVKVDRVLVEEIVFEDSGINDGFVIKKTY
jgi:acylphosphatase